MLNKIEDAIKDIKEGKMVIVVDDESRENEGDLVIPADMVTPDVINFMTKYGRGLICMPIMKKKAVQLGLNDMVATNTDNHQTAFTVSVDHIDTTTGISAYERALTIEKMVNDTNPNNFRRPGHMFPLIAKDGLLQVRDGHTEASIELSILAGFSPNAVICEILNDDGTMARLDDLSKFREVHNLKIISIEDLKKYVDTYKKLEYVTKANMPTDHGEFDIHGFYNPITKKEHIVLTKGNVSGDDLLVRVHSECFTGDTLGSQRCDCGNQLHKAMEQINKEGRGMIIYLRQEGRGIGLHNKLKAYHLQDKGYDTVEANIKLGFKDELREFSEAAYILNYFNVNSIHLITNNPLKINELKSKGIQINKRVESNIKPNKHNEFYLKTKQQKMNHILDI